MFKPIRQEDCDPNDPAQFAAFAVQFIPRPVGEWVQIQPQFTPSFSALLWALGYRHHEELQTLRQTEDGYGWEKVSADDSTG